MSDTYLSEIDSADAEKKKSIEKFFVIATPIGNLEDISIRALKILRGLDIILCEDTRRAAALLNKFHIKAKLIICNEQTGDKNNFQILNLILSGKKAGLISDAGTPMISDPGFELLNFLILNNIRIIPVPGACAAIAALSAAGLPADKFLFIGFLPHKTQAAKKMLSNYVTTKATLILYESPNRVFKTLEILFELFGDKNIVISRELTKYYEEIIRGKLSDFTARNLDTPDRGEFVILLDNRTESSENFETDSAAAQANYKNAGQLFEFMRSNNIHPSDAIRILSEVFSIKKNILYERLIKQNSKFI